MCGLSVLIFFWSHWGSNSPLPSIMSQTASWVTGAHALFYQQVLSGVSNKRKFKIQIEVKQFYIQMSSSSRIPWSNWMTGLQSLVGAKLHVAQSRNTIVSIGYEWLVRKICQLDLFNLKVVVYHRYSFLDFYIH